MTVLSSSYCLHSSGHAAGTCISSTPRRCTTSLNLSCGADGIAHAGRVLVRSTSRIVALAVFVALVVGMVALGLWRAGMLTDDDRAADIEAPYRTADGPGTVVVPGLVGTPVSEAGDLLRAAGMVDPLWDSRWIADDSIPAGIVTAQAPSPNMTIAPNTTIAITVSAGGPAISFDELPDHVAEWLTSTRRSPFGAEPILVVDTAQGVAYKTDTLLFGPCDAVDAAYRTFQDPIYNDRCY